MIDFALNHMTVPTASWSALIDIAARLGCVGIEVRNDLGRPLFDGRAPEEAGEMARDKGLRILCVSEIKQFDAWDDDRALEARSLAGIAAAADAEAVCLIPRNDGTGTREGERRANLRDALREIRPMLEDAGLAGLVEPLGFESCALRHKSEAVEAIEDLGAAGTFRLVHDTFHHHLAGGGPLFPDHTGMVHVSGVVDPDLTVSEMEDGHRILVDERDRLGNTGQIAALMAAGYAGPVSFEVFAREVHDIDDPVAALGVSMELIRAHRHFLFEAHHHGRAHRGARGAGDGPGREHHRRAVPGVGGTGT